MKIFWGFIGLLAVLTAGLLISGRSDREPSTETHEPAALTEAAVDEPSSAREAAPGASRPPAIEPESAAPRPELEPTNANAEPQIDPHKIEPPAGDSSSPDEAIAGAGQDAPGAREAEDGVLTPNAPAEIGRLKPQVDKQDEAELDALVNELLRAANEEDQPTETQRAAEPETTGESSDASADASEDTTAPAPVEVEGATDSSEGASDAAGGGGPEPASGKGAPIGEQVKPAPKADPTKPEIVPSTFETREDGAILADKRFVIRGQGTKEKPYVVTWDMLVSASELYDPRRGKLKLPERIKMLDGKYVKVVGYVTFPIVAEGPNEMLAMLNAWDGCCIGVPPTPYDAVEVRLAQPASAEQMLMSWGSVTGKFKVEPYLAADWLLGLYLMQDAVLEAESM